MIHHTRFDSERQARDRLGVLLRTIAEVERERKRARFLHAMAVALAVSIVTALFISAVVAITGAT